MGKRKITGSVTFSWSPPTSESDGSVPANDGQACMSYMSAASYVGGWWMNIFFRLVYFSLPVIVTHLSFKKSETLSDHNKKIINTTESEFHIFID